MNTEELRHRGRYERTGDSKRKYISRVEMYEQPQKEASRASSVSFCSHSLMSFFHRLWSIYLFISHQSENPSVRVRVCFERKRLKNKIMKRIIQNVLLLVCRMSFELLPRNNYTLKKKKKLFVGPSINIYVHARDDGRRMMLKLSSILWTGFMHFTNI